MDNIQELLIKWRLVLGENSDELTELNGNNSLIDESLSFIYNHAYDERGAKGMKGGSEKSNLTVPDWINNVKTLFPENAATVMTNDALKKFNLSFLLSDKHILDNVKADLDLLKNILNFRKVISPEHMSLVKKIVEDVSREISEKIKKEISPKIFSSKKSFLRSNYKRLKNFDFKNTVLSNLKNYDLASKKLAINSLRFTQNADKTTEKELILVVDQSGSMSNSVINTSVLAAILYATNFIKVKLIAFDTSIIDLTEKCENVAELLLSVQLGGGTDIAPALSFASSFIKKPKNTAVVLISDLYDGGSEVGFLIEAKSILNDGAKLLCLTALDYNGNAEFNKNLARKAEMLGAEVATLSPKELCDWLIKKI